MTAKRDAVKHYRNGPEMDVAMCGERGSQVSFSRARGGITCGVCKVRLQKAIDNKRLKANEMGRAAYYKARGIQGGWG